MPSRLERLAALFLFSTLVFAKPIPVKVVVVTMFEPGADTGDRPGDFQLWVEREPLNQVIPFPQGYRNLRRIRLASSPRSQGSAPRGCLKVVLEKQALAVYGSGEGRNFIKKKLARQIK